MDRKETIVNVLTIFGEAFRQKISDTTLKVYEMGLEGLSSEQIMDVASKAIQQCKFMPTIAELRELAGDDKKTQSMLAWASFERAMPLGPYRHVNFRDKLINATVRAIGGWVHAFDRCNSPHETKWYRKEFIDTYERFAASGASDEMCEPLTGISESTVSGGKMVAPKAIMIECETVKHPENRLKALR